MPLSGGEARREKLIMGVHSDPSPLGTLCSTAAVVVALSAPSPTVHFNGRTSAAAPHPSTLGAFICLRREIERAVCSLHSCSVILARVLVCH